MMRASSIGFFLLKILWLIIVIAMAVWTIYSWIIAGTNQTLSIILLFIFTIPVLLFQIYKFQKGNGNK